MEAKHVRRYAGRHQHGIRELCGERVALRFVEQVAFVEDEQTRMFVGVDFGEDLSRDFVLVSHCRVGSIDDM